MQSLNLFLYELNIFLKSLSNLKYQASININVNITNIIPIFIYNGTLKKNTMRKSLNYL